MRIRLFAVAAVVAALACEGGGGNFGTGINRPPPPPSPPGTTTEVAIIDNAFALATVSVVAGSTVRWTNAGGQVHNVTGDGGTFASGSIDPGGTFQRVFPAAGVFPYQCTIHTGMTGTVTVTP